MRTTCITLVLLALAIPAKGGESALTTTFQPLAGLGAGRIHVTPVTCHDVHPGPGSAIRLISASNVPPTDAPNIANADLNLASLCGVTFIPGDLGAPRATPSLTMDCTKYVAPPKQFAYPREEIIRACLECLRRNLSGSLLKVPVRLRASEANTAWMSRLVDEFNRHDRRNPFPHGGANLGLEAPGDSE